MSFEFFFRTQANFLGRDFIADIEIMLAFADNGLSRSECAKIKRLQIIQYMARSYTEAVYFPRGPLKKSDIKAGKTTIGDIAQTFRDLLKNPLQDATILPFVPGPTTPHHQFFQDFPGLTFSLKKFSREDLNLILPTLGYTWSTLPSQQNRFNGDSSNLYDIMAIMPELSEQVQKLYNKFKPYFSDYIGATGVKDFAVKFYLPKNYGFVKFGSLLRNSVSVSFRKDSDKQLIDELKGEFLEFTVNNADDLDKMVANIIYYMLKYNCLAAVNEGYAVKGDINPDTKYALIASPGRLYNADFLLTSFRDSIISININNDGLSAKAVQLYRDLFGVEQSDLYLVSNKLNHYSSIWDKSFIFSPYLMANSHLFRQHVSNLFTRKTNIIEDLKPSSSYRT